MAVIDFAFVRLVTLGNAGDLDMADAGDIVLQRNAEEMCIRDSRRSDTMILS